MITGVDTYLILTRAYPDSVRFHRDVLGLPVAFELPGATVFDVGGLTITVTRAETDLPPLLSFYVDNLPAALVRLRERGHEPEAPPDALGDGAMVATVRAPGGARYGLFQPPAESVAEGR
jgi:catechol 2,3-dioxygenase-like lactoylglutathione lyase family enzyme